MTNRSPKRSSRYFVYILRCADGSYYTGYTSNLAKRVALHNRGGGSKYVRSKLPAKLIFKKKYRYYKNALNEERRIKTLSRKRKNDLIHSIKKGKNLHHAKI